MDNRYQHQQQQQQQQGCDPSVDYRALYSSLKRKFSVIAEEKDDTIIQLEHAKKQLKKLASEKRFLLDRLLKFEEVSSDSDSESRFATKPQAHPTSLPPLLPLHSSHNSNMLLISPNVGNRDNRDRDRDTDREQLQQQQQQHIDRDRERQHVKRERAPNGSSSKKSNGRLGGQMHIRPPTVSPTNKGLAPGEDMYSMLPDRDKSDAEDVSMAALSSSRGLQQQQQQHPTQQSLTQPPQTMMLDEIPPGLAEGHEGYCMAFGKDRLCKGKALANCKYCWHHAPLDPNSDFVWCQYENKNKKNSKKCNIPVQKWKLQPFCGYHQTKAQRNLNSESGDDDSDSAITDSNNKQARASSATGPSTSSSIAAITQPSTTPTQSSKKKGHHRREPSSSASASANASTPMGSSPVSLSPPSQYDAGGDTLKFHMYNIKVNSNNHTRAEKITLPPTLPMRPTYHASLSPPPLGSGDGESSDPIDVVV
ncbi:hypothetical protein SAMD00019534_102530 [Acytostelium subglobosum LB1]|uniref:hypothetical protein n=1 Tax=Acytostelium subglobosum LB1 TaxID=1410327 RepID=UPI000644F897|nr:hypothetical protein SAMD00019534_102530 [Acytostelium subglobosum LB1]GAM27078.1 hypothetical protein SAMD00019534_102530 [Acytostelium subglobosum LB1]|eukprot:XP_012749958.1 hypothetical protein SAMD00019534_102530 [Acytostelium subglobosum LB1]